MQKSSNNKTVFIQTDKSNVDFTSGRMVEIFN